MTSTIKVNTIQNTCGADIIKESSNTITIGASGDTIALASGASQTGFGRTGTVNWVTTKKTTGFTAVSGEGYFCDTAASGAFTLTLPSSPSAGDIVGLKDYNGNFGTANLTIGRNGSPINGGSAVDPVISTDGASILLVYVDASQGWVATNDDESTFSGENFIVASGGTTADCGNFRTHTFTGPGTFTVSSISATAANNIADYLVVGAGGGGGGGRAGGGGAGGFRTSNALGLPGPTTSPLASPTGITLTATAFPIAVGSGGTGQSANVGTNGNVATFSTITSAGGGGGGQDGKTGGDGGSGGGGGESSVGSAIGAGNTPPVAPPQGNPGGASQHAPPTGGPHPASPAPYAGGGGGGAGAQGGRSDESSPPGAGGPGGIGSFISTTFAGSNGTTGPVSSTRYFAGGGGGYGCASSNPGGTAPGGAGGGGAGGANAGVAGTANTGGGGGAEGNIPGGVGATGGSGIVIIRYKFQ